MPKALVIRTAGTNCDAEMVRAFELAGAEAGTVHLDRLIAEPQRLEQYDLIAFPGGFSYGDDVASGRIFAMRARERLWPALAAAAGAGVPMLGACNGFQVMVQIGLLPGPERAGAWPPDTAPAQEASLGHNIGGRFIDRWVRVTVDPASPCVWTRGLAEAFAEENGRDEGGGASRARLCLPIAHGEGRFVADPAVVTRMEAAGQVPLRYRADVNGSTGNIAGVCDAGGRVFGLMPHPERYTSWPQHPFWTRLDGRLRTGDTPGMMMFRSAVESVSSAR